MEFPESVALYRVTPRDLPRAQAVLTDAFSNDPFFAYALGSLRYADARAELFHRFTLSYGIRYGYVFGSSPGLEGVSIWLPPGNTTMPTWRTLRSGVLSLRRLGFPRISDRREFFLRMMRFSDFSGGLHKKHAPFPHWYLLAIGVAAEHRGKGFAARLLRPMLDYLDRISLPCYLETHNAANPRIYEHFGFRVAEVGTLPGSDTRQWAMVRMPNGSA